MAINMNKENDTRKKSQSMKQKWKELKKLKKRKRRRITIWEEEETIKWKPENNKYKKNKNIKQYFLTK